MPTKKISQKPKVKKIEEKLESFSEEPMNENMPSEGEKKNYLTYGLIALLCIASFAIGSLYTKVKTFRKKRPIGSRRTTTGRRPTE